MKNFPIWLKILIVIVELIIHASAIFMIMLIVYCLKTNPDFGMTDNKIHYDHIDYTAKSDVYDLKNFSNEITSIVRKYKSDAKLVNIAYITKTTGEDVNDKKLYNDEFIKPLEKDLTSMLNDYSNKNATLEIDNSGIKIYHHIFKYSNISFD